MFHLERLRTTHCEEQRNNQQVSNAIAHERARNIAPSDGHLDDEEDDYDDKIAAPKRHRV